MLNKVQLIGNLGRDPEIRHAQSGTTIANLSLATTKKWTDRDSGERQERTEWHRVAIFGRLAEVAEKYLSKGSRIYIEGELRTRKWQDQSGNDRYSTEVVVSGFGGTLIMLGGGSRSSDSGGGNGGGYRTERRREEPRQQRAPADDFDDDIPF